MYTTEPDSFEHIGALATRLLDGLAIDHQPKMMAAPAIAHRSRIPLSNAKKRGSASRSEPSDRIAAGGRNAIRVDHDARLGALRMQDE